MSNHNAGVKEVNIILDHINRCEAFRSLKTIIPLFLHRSDVCGHSFIQHVFSTSLAIVSSMQCRLKVFKVKSLPVSGEGSREVKQ